MLPNFVAKVTVGRRNCLSLNGRPILDQFADLRSHLIDSVNRDAAALFAEPVMTRKGDEIEIAWYAEQAGQPVPISSLDPDVQGFVIAKLKARLAAIAPLLSGPFGALLSRALYVADANDIMAVGQDPLLIQWSILPDTVSSSNQAALDVHFAATLGRYTTIDAPRIARPPAPTARPVPDIAPPPRAEAAASNPARTHRMFSNQHLGLMIATAVAAASALLLALPSILASPIPVQKESGDALIDAQKITKAMEDKVARARGALNVANCDPNGRVTVPDDRQGQLPPQPIPIRPGDGPAKGNMSLVARRATESVVFVYTCTDQDGWNEVHKDDKEKSRPFRCPKVDGDSSGADQDNLLVLGSGSGFFVAPKTIVTNFHVVRHSKAVFVTSHLLGRAQRVKILATTPPGDTYVAPDFALLSVDIPNSPPPIELSLAPVLLQDVVAAGFPAVVINEDIDRDKLFHGDTTAVPGLTTFPGSVTLIKYPDQPMQLIYSSAVIGHGNSGGPLLDLCARAIGMNTFGWSGTAEDTGYKVNIAEGAKALSAFLDENHITHGASTQGCDLGVEAKLDKPQDKPKPSPVPDAPPTGFGK